LSQGIGVLQIVVQIRLCNGAIMKGNQINDNQFDEDVVPSINPDNDRVIDDHGAEGEVGRRSNLEMGGGMWLLGDEIIWLLGEQKTTVKSKQAGWVVDGGSQKVASDEIPSYLVVCSISLPENTAFNRSMESIILNRITSEILGAYQTPNLAMSEWCRNTAHSIVKLTIRQLWPMPSTFLFPFLTILASSKRTKSRQLYQPLRPCSFFLF
jgi:hypothetical protein